ncbi:hypothetical protein [Eoetvoesiella caeni]
MASTVIVSEWRARMAAFHAGGPALAPFGFMAFGDGGHNPDGTPKAPDPDTPTLGNVVAIVPLHNINQPNPFTVSCEGRIEPGTLVGVSVSEAALLDADGRYVAKKNFAPKIREADELYQVFIEPLF